MEDIRQDSILAFDTRFTNNHTQMLKILLPFCQSSLQKYIAIYIHILELQCVLEYFSKVQPSACKESPFDFNLLFPQLLPYCNPAETKTFTQIRNLFETMENVKNMMDMIETMKELFPEGMGSSENDCLSPDMLTAMMNMFGGNSNEEFSPEMMAAMSGFFQ